MITSTSLVRIAGGAAATAALAAAALLPRAGSAQSSPALGLSTSNGHAVVFISGLDPQDNFNGFDITLTFDGSIAEASEVTGGAGWTTDLVAPIITANTVRVVGVNLSQSCTSSCTLFSVAFDAVSGSGSASISVTNASLATASGGSHPSAGLPSGSVPIVVLLTPTATSTTTSGGGGATSTPISPAATATATRTATSAPATATATRTSTVATATATATTPAAATATPTSSASATATSPANATPTSARTVVAPLPPATGGGVEPSSNGNWFATAAIAGLVIASGAALVARRR